MVGLLPEIYSQAFKREKFIIRIFSAAVILSFVFILGLTFLLPSYFSLVFSLDHVLRNLGTEEVSIKRKNVEEVDNKISYANSITDSYFYGESKRKFFSAILLSLVNPVSNDVKLTGIDFEKSAEEGFVFRLRGEAATRSALIVYSQKLREIPQIKELRSPVSNLLQETNVKFILEAVVNPKDYATKN